MPLPPLKDPPELAERIAGAAKGLPISTLMMSTLLGFNAIQTASLALLPFSRRRFRAVNRWAAGSWWGGCVEVAQRLSNARIEVTGDQVPMRENTLIVANHQQMPDIPYLLALARTKDRIGDIKFFVKDPIKYFPGVGWGMLFLDCVFVKRNWASDAENIERTFARLRGDKVPLWLVSFVEGTRASSSKIAACQEFARKHGLRPPEHVQLPRTKGFVATVNGLRDHLDAVYDVTIGYERGVPTLWQYIKGFAGTAHLHVRRYPTDTLPTDPDELTTWLFERFAEKDELMSVFYRDGAFPQP